MTLNLKNVLAAVLVVAVSTMQFGCGEGSETNAPAVKLTASTVVSSTDSAHLHSVSIPFIDVSSSPADAGSQYRSDIVNGHSHVIALSKQQMIDLNNGMQLTLISSESSTGASHTHTWSIQGGSVLYEKSCYNCHSNDKRGKTPMNVSFNASQIFAVKSPASAPVSTSTPAIPDPNFIPGSVTLDGASLYAGACATCHGALTSTNIPKTSRTVSMINLKIISVPGMNSLSSLTQAQIDAIASILIIQP